MYLDPCKMTALAVRAFKAALSEATEQGLSDLLGALELKRYPFRLLEIPFEREADQLLEILHQGAWRRPNGERVIQQQELPARMLAACLERHGYAPEDFYDAWEYGLIDRMDLLRIADRYTTARTFRPKHETRWVQGG